MPEDILERGCIGENISEPEPQDGVSASVTCSLRASKIASIKGLAYVLVIDDFYYHRIFNGDCIPSDFTTVILYPED